MKFDVRYRWDIRDIVAMWAEHYLPNCKVTLEEIEGEKTSKHEVIIRSRGERPEKLKN